MEIKMIKILLMSVFAYYSISCNKNSSSVNKKFQIDKVTNDSKGKFILKDDIYYKFHFKSDTTYTIEWGNKLFKNETKKTFDIQGNGTLNLLKSGKNAIILNQNCGTSCNYYVVLPLQVKSTEKMFMNVIAYDESKNLVAYISEGKPFIAIENYLSGQKLNIFENNLCPAALKGDCIDSSYFEGNTFVIKWEGSKWDNDKKDPQIKTVSIKGIY